MNAYRCAACTLLAGAITIDAVGHRFDHPHVHVSAPSENATFVTSTTGTISSSARSTMPQGSGHAPHLR